MLKKSTQLLNKIANKFDSEDPLMIDLYRGFASEERLYLKGRVLENEGVFLSEDQTRIRTLIDNFKRFESDEIEGARVKIKVRDHIFEVYSDEEGYFEVDEAWDTPLSPKENRWIDSHAQLIDTMDLASDGVQANGEIFFPSVNADFGVISDVDDTVLQTHATSLFRLKMMYVTFFKDPYERLPMDGIDKIYAALEKGSNGKKENPIFYVSNSPWNIHDNIETFLEVNQFPKGPVLLRDAGIHLMTQTSKTWGHKMETISQILKTYPDLPFVMLGDTASKDADHYLDLAKEFEGRVKAIYIRHTRNTRNARRIANLVEANTDVNIVLVKNSDEIMEHAIIHGLVK
ncbi:MAG: phosphatase domain-containing protein [Bacteroidota bacterium]